MKSDLSIKKDAVHRRNNILYAILSFVIPQLILLVVWLERSVILKGSFTLFYPEFFDSFLLRVAALKQSSVSHIFSFRGNGARGFDFIAAIAAVLPFDITKSTELALLFSVALCSVLFFFCMKYHRISDMASFLTAVMFSLSSYAFVAENVSYGFNIMLLTPLCLISARRLALHHRPAVLMAVIGAGLLCDVRSGWILFFVSLFWLAYLCVTDSTAKKPYEKSFLLWGMAVLGGVLIGFVRLYPEFRDVLVGIDIVGVRFDFLSFFAKMLPAVTDGVRPGGYPYVWFGLAGIFCVPLYFCSGAFSKKEKTATALILISAFISMSFSIINCFADIFGEYSLPVYIQTPFFGFLVLYTAAKVLDTGESMSRGALYAVFGIITGVLMLIQRTGLSYYDNEGKLTENYISDLNTIWISLLVLMLITFALHAFFKADGAKAKRTAALCLVLIICSEFTFGNIKLTKSFQSEYGYIRPEGIGEFYDAYREASEYIKENASGWYRSDKTQSLAPGDISFTDERGVAGIGAEPYITQMLAFLGVHNNEGTTEYSHICAALDALLGISYLSDAKEPEKEPEKPEPEEPDKKKDPSKFELIKNTLFTEQQYGQDVTYFKTEISALYDAVYDSENVTVYKNPYALGVISAFAASLADIDFSLPTEGDLVYDETLKKYRYPDEFLGRDDLMFSPAERLNKIWSTLCGVSDLEVVLPLTHFISVNSTVTTVDDVGQNKYVCSNENAKEKSSVQLRATIGKPTHVLLTLPALTGRYAEIYVNGKAFGSVNYGNKPENSFLDLGVVEKGVLTVDIYYGAKNFEDAFYLLPDYSYLYTPNDEAFKTAVQNMKMTAATVTEMTRNSIKANINANGDMTHIFTLLPYSECWQVKVDGKTAETYSSAGAFLGFDLSGGGEHEISICYKNVKTLGATGAVSVFGCVGLAFALGGEIYLWVYKKKKEISEDKAGENGNKKN